jgi:hypothetical protein
MWPERFPYSVSRDGKPAITKYFEQYGQTRQKLRSLTQTPNGPKP